MALLEARGLVKWYGPRKVVDGVSFDVNAGEVVGLLGPNGAGKTTSFRMSTGQIPPNEGMVRFNNQDVTRLPMYQRARLGMGYLSQEPSIFRKLSVEKNIIAILEALPRSRGLGRRLSRRERWERTDAVLARFNLLHVRKNSAARCSGGEKRRLEIARCLVCEPLLILLDEPFAAVDPLTKEDIRHNIRELANHGIGILLTDHDVREVLKITDRSYLIKDGKVIAHGTPDEIKRNPIAIQAYLGNTFADEPIGFLTPAPSEPPVQRVHPIEMPAVPASAPATHPAIPLAAEEPAQPIRLEEPEPKPVLPPPPPVQRAAPTPVEVTPPPLRMPAVPAMPMNTSPTGGLFSSAAMVVIEQEKIRRLIDQFMIEERWQEAYQSVLQRGHAAIPVLLEALERREMKIRHLACKLLEQILGETLTFQADAPDDVRLRQVAHLRVRFERQRGDAA